MTASPTATEVAFLLIAATQAVAAIVWSIGAVFVRDERPALAHWAVYAATSAATWTALAAHFRAPPLAVVVAGACAAIVLRRGILRFVGRPMPWTAPALALALIIAAGLLLDDAPSRPLQAAVNFGVLAALYATMALDLRRHAADDLHWRLPALLALPLLAGALAYASRAAQALFDPGSVLAAMAADSRLNVGSAIAYLVLVLMLHATLATLVVARLLGRLHRLARRDPLTGLLNRRAMHELLDEHASRLRRAGDTFAVLLVDLDHFKAINDRHGHDVGDRALVHATHCIAQALRAQDRIGRQGGDEFVVLLPGCDVRRAAAEAERLRLEVQASPLQHAGAVLPLSLTIGVAQWAGAGEDCARLLARADEALLRAKRSGRNRVETAAPAPAPPGAIAMH